jgi:glycine cleavage system H protein
MTPAGAGMYPTDLKYTRDHEWIRFDNEDALVGITDFAQKQLGDVVFVDLPEAGRTVTQGEVFGTIESVKAVSELFSPVSGEIVAVNPDLGSHPEQVNSRPHETWMIRLRPSTPADAASLLDAAAYGELVKS